MDRDRESTDAELWRRAVEGDAHAFESLFDRHANDLFAFCLRRTGDRGAAEDLMSTTFLHAWRRRQEMRPTENGPVPWLYGIATNLVRRHLRSVGRRRAAVARVALAEDEPDPSEGIAGRLDDARRAERALRALSTMPERDQELFVLCVWQELSYEEAAAALGIPVGTVRSRLSRARSRLRGLVGEPAGERGDRPDDIPDAHGRKAGRV